PRGAQRSHRPGEAPPRLDGGVELRAPRLPPAARPVEAGASRPRAHGVVPPPPGRGKRRRRRPARRPGHPHRPRTLKPFPCPTWKRLQSWSEGHSDRRTTAGDTRARRRIASNVTPCASTTAATTTSTGVTHPNAGPVVSATEPAAHRHTGGASSSPTGTPRTTAIARITAVALAITRWAPQRSRPSTLSTTRSRRRRRIVMTRPWTSV